MNQIRPRLSPREYDALRSFRGKRNVGIIGDTHYPFCLRGYEEFCYETFNRFGVTDIVHIGDLVDNHAISYHESDPDGMSAGDEGDEAYLKVQAAYKLLPFDALCIGNHDRLPERQAQSSGLPRRHIRSFKEVWGLPSNVAVDFSHKIDGVKYVHGTRNSGMYAHVNLAIKNMMPTVMGHVHAYAGADYRASEDRLIWGLGVGCGVDREAYAAAYGREFPSKPVIACGVVLDDGKIPACIPMNIT